MMISRPQQFLFLCLLLHPRVSSSRAWTDVVDPSKVNDGMPRVSPPRDKSSDLAAVAASTTSALSHMLAQHIEIEMQGASTTLFEEVDPFRVTSEPSSAPSYGPTSVPSVSPSVRPTTYPSTSPTDTFPPTNYPTRSPTRRPTASPTYAKAAVPRDPGPGYFNYDPRSPYGPKRWKYIKRIERDDPGYFWHTFELGDSDDMVNDCGSGKKQSPVDVCVKPRESCTETHEMRPKVRETGDRTKRLFASARGSCRFIRPKTKQSDA